MTPFSPEITFADHAYQSYLQGLKQQWKHAVYDQVAVDAARSAARTAPELEGDLRERSSAYRLYGWLERHLQQFKYVGRHGMLPVMERQAGALTAALDAAARRHPERLQLDPGLQLPAYFTVSDFHQHPGGIWSDDVDAFAYEWAANAFSFSMIAADAPYRWLAGYLADRFAPESVIDLGCGFGKLCIPFKQKRPETRVTGVDLAAPLLRLAHLRSLEAGLDIEWVQANAERVPRGAGSYAGILSYWLFHELPPEAARHVLGEAFRLARPGGFFASLDMYTAPGGLRGEFLHLGHAARNNEPYLPAMMASDPCEAMRAAGFVEVELIESMTAKPITHASHAGEALASTRTHVFSVAIGRKPA
ncbi:MAG: class I SAM-dependent methyltransferase [Lautropia sp.]